MFLFNKYISNPNEYTLKIAKKALKHNDVPIGAIIVQKIKNNRYKLISASENRVQIDKNPTAHAEILAINKATKKLNSKFLDNCIMFVSLEPCSMCATAISLARISEIAFLCHDEKGGGILHNSKIYDTDKHLWKPIITDLNSLYSKESAKLLKDFFQTLRKDKK